jgi:hypothetical protein
MLLKTILSSVLVSFCFITSAQNGMKNSIGLQLNPYVDEDLFNGNSTKFVYALRYNIKINDHITLGPEFSGYHSKLLYLEPDYSYSNFNAGGFFRYSFLPASRINPFLELSPYYTFLRYKNLPDNAYNGVGPNGKDGYLSGYLAPGVSLFSKSRKISLDLFYKFSNKMLVNSEKSVFSYRLNFRF